MSTPWVNGANRIGEDEIPYLKALGGELKRLRQESGLTWLQFGYGSLVSRAHLLSMSRGVVRTRRSTLERIASAAVEANPELGPVGEVVEWLCAVAGPALASESSFPERTGRRLERRRRNREKGYWFP